MLAVEGPLSGQVLERAGLPAPQDPFSHVAWNQNLINRFTATGASGFRIFLQPGQKNEIVARLEEAGAAAADPEAVRSVRLEHGKPRYGEDIFDNNLVHETQQLYAVHFNKGCYLGQEIVERVRSRGQVNRLLVGLRIEGSAPPPAGTALAAGELEAGKVTSAAWSPAEYRVAALAYVRRENAEPGFILQCEGRAAEVRIPYSP
jgi:aminomethyltransferase